MKYEDIKTPDELRAFMGKNIQYGFVGKDGLVHREEDDFENTVFTEWRLASPEDLIKDKYGHCFDQVELERDWLSSHGYECKTFMIIFELPYDNNFSMHTYLVYFDNGEWKYIEHADGLFRGEYVFPTLEDAIRYQKKHHINANMIYNPTDEKLASIRIYEYKKPKYGITMDEFIDYVIENGVVQYI